MADTYQLQRHETSLFNGRGDNSLNEGYATDGSDLYIERDIPDDIRLLDAKIEMDTADIEAPLATIVANELLRTIMMEFYEAGKDFKIHQDEALRLFVKEKIQERLVDVLGEGVIQFADDAWLNDRLALIRGFPPNRYEDPFDEEE